MAPTKQTTPAKAAPAARPAAAPAKAQASATNAPGPAGSPLTTSSEVVSIATNDFAPSAKVAGEIDAAGSKGLDVRVIVAGLTSEGVIHIISNNGNYRSHKNGWMPLLHPWMQQLGGMYLNFDVKQSVVTGGFASLAKNSGSAKEWLTKVKAQSDVLIGKGIKLDSLPSVTNKFDNGVLTLGVEKLHIEVGGYLDANLDLSVENNNTPRIDATAKVTVGGLATGDLALSNASGAMAGSVELAVNFKSFSGKANVVYNPDGSVNIAGTAAYSGDKLSGEISFVATDLPTANEFAKTAIASAGGKENVQQAKAPAKVPDPKKNVKQRGIAATGLLSFNMTDWFAGSVFVVLDAKGHVTVIGKITPPAEVQLFAQKDWKKRLFKFEAKAYYGIPVVGNLNLFASISLDAIARLGPAKLYNIEVLGTYSTDPEIQKSIQISGSINVSAYAGLSLVAEGGAGIEILSHDLKFGVGLHADVGVKAYADARPTIGFRDPGKFFISGTLDLVAQPVLGLGGEFFIAIETPWWSPLSDDRWSWPLFSKEWPLGQPIGISASMKDYELGSGNVPEIEMKPPEFDPSKFMTNMVDKQLPDKSSGEGSGSGSLKEDGSIQKPVEKPKIAAKPQSTTAGKGKGKGGLKDSGSKSPDKNAAAAAAPTKQLDSAVKELKKLSSGGEQPEPEMNEAVNKLKSRSPAVTIEKQTKPNLWLMTPKLKGKKQKSEAAIPLKVKGVAPGGHDKKEGRTAAEKSSDLTKGVAEASALLDDKALVHDDIVKKLVPIKTKYSMATLALMTDSKDGNKEFDHIHGEIHSDKTELDGPKKAVKIAEPGKDAKVPHYGGPANGFGTSARLQCLTTLGPANTPSVSDTEHWKALKTRKGGKAEYYVRGHLLNGVLGGTGSSWNNLTPLTQATNNPSALSMLHTFETPVKGAVTKAVEAKNWIDFSVVAVYGRADRSSAVAKDLKKVGDPVEAAKIGNIIAAEKHVPSEIHCKAVEMNGTKQVSVVKDLAISNEVDTTFAHYTTEETARKYVYLNSSKTNKKDLMSLNGVDEKLANRILAMPAFADRDDAIQKLGASTWHKMASTAGISVRLG